LDDSFKILQTESNPRGDHSPQRIDDDIVFPLLGELLWNTPKNVEDISGNGTSYRCFRSSETLLIGNTSVTQLLANTIVDELRERSEKNPLSLHLPPPLGLAGA
jgi:hypothetical protein